MTYPAGARRAAVRCDDCALGVHSFGKETGSGQTEDLALSCQSHSNTIITGKESGSGQSEGLALSCHSHSNTIITGKESGSGQVKALALFLLNCIGPKHFTIDC